MRKASQEYKQTYGKVQVPRRKRRSAPPYNLNRLDARGTLTSTVRTYFDPLVIQPWTPIFPARRVLRTRYSSNASIAFVSSAVGTYILRANDLFDPDFTGTGHQPMGFDQMMLFYNHFTVVRANLIATFINTGTTPVTVSIRQDADSTPITVVDRIVELGGNVINTLESKSVSGSVRTLQLSLDVAKLQGVSQSAITSDPSLQGSAAASPIEVTYFHLQCWDTLASSSTVQVDYILEQESVFTEPRNNVES